MVENLNSENGNIAGTVSVTSGRDFAITGYVEGSAGKVTTTVSQNIVFQNLQNFNINSTNYVQDITQNTQIYSTTIEDSTGTRVTSLVARYPLTVDISLGPLGNNLAQTTSIHQEYHYQTTDAVNGKVTFTNERNNAVGPTDTVLLDQNFHLIGNQG